MGLGIAIGNAIGRAVSPSSYVPLTGEVFRDQFTTAVDPIASPRTAEPGPGTWTVAGSLWKVVVGALRGGGQAVPTWGNSRLKHTNGLSRVAGRALVAYVIPEDANADLAVGWATGTVADPRTDGHAWLLENSTLAVAAPSLKVLVNNGARNLKPIEYLVIVLLNGTGATYLLSTYAAESGGGGGDVPGVPAYPDARVLWVEDAATTATLYPVVQAYDTFSYPNATFLDDLRVLDVAAYAGSDHPLATLVDRMTRADSTTSLGSGWTAGLGTWGISSNKGYLQTSAGLNNARKSSGLSGDGIWKYKLTFDSASATRGIGCIVRAVDASNFVRIWTNGAASISVQTWVAGGFDATIDSTGFVWTVGQTYDITIMTSGNRYRIFIDGVNPWGSETWLTDANSRHLAGTGFGPYASAATDARWDDFVCTPLTVTLPAALQQGAAPAAWTVGSTQVSAAFTAVNGTLLTAYTTETGSKTFTAVNGTWEVQSNKATTSAGAGQLLATFAEVTADYEASVDVTMPGAFTTNTIRAGLALKVGGTTDYLDVRLYKDASTCEIEIEQYVAGSGAVVKKVDLTSSAFAINTTYTLKAQVKATDYGLLLRVFLAGVPRLSYVVPSTFVGGTGVGLYRASTDDGCVFDNLTIKALS